MEKDLHTLVVQQNTLTVTSFNAFVQDHQSKALVADGGNAHFVFPDLTARTLLRARASLQSSVVEAGGIVTTARAQAARNWQAAYANLAVLSVFKGKILPECWLNSDMLGICVGDQFEQTVRLLAPTRSIDLMRMRNLRVATTKDGSKCRGMNIMASHSLAGRLVHFATIVRDESILEYEIIRIDDDFTNWLVPTGWDKQEFFRHYQEQALIPSIRRVRQELLKYATIDRSRVQLRPAAVVEAVGAAAAAAAAAPVLEDYTSLPVLSTCDGEWEQFEALFDADMRALLKTENMMVVKHSASASPTENTGDAGAMHKTMHAELATWSYRMRKPGQPTSNMARFIEYFKSLKIENSEVFVDLYERIEAVKSKAFSSSALLAAGDTCGYHPFNEDKIMSGFTGWKDVSNTTASALMKCVISYSEAEYSPLFFFYFMLSFKLTERYRRSLITSE